MLIKPHFIFSGRPLSQLSRIQGIAIPTIETLPMANQPGLESTDGPSACTDQDRLSESPACHRRRSFLNEPSLVWRLAPERLPHSQAHFSPTVYIHEAPPDISFHCARASSQELSRLARFYGLGPPGESYAGSIVRFSRENRMRDC